MSTAALGMHYFYNNVPDAPEWAVGTLAATHQFQTTALMFLIVWKFEQICLSVSSQNDDLVNMVIIAYLLSSTASWRLHWQWVSSHLQSKPGNSTQNQQHVCHSDIKVFVEVSSVETGFPTGVEYFPDWGNIFAWAYNFYCEIPRSPLQL